MDPHSQRSYLPPHIPDYHTRNYPSNAGAPGPRFFFEQEIVFRMIILNEMVGSIIGKGGSTIRALQSETGTCIKILEPVADSDERVVAISAREVCLWAKKGFTSVSMFCLNSEVITNLCFPYEEQLNKSSFYGNLVFVSVPLRELSYHPNAWLVDCCQYILPNYNRDLGLIFP
jgi:predicted RNA-binding protein YlqC (UPF0109 family)